MFEQAVASIIYFGLNWTHCTGPVCSPLSITTLLPVSAFQQWTLPSDDPVNAVKKQLSLCQNNAKTSQAYITESHELPPKIVRNECMKLENQTCIFKHFCKALCCEERYTNVRIQYNTSSFWTLVAKARVIQLWGVIAVSDVNKNVTKQFLSVTRFCRFVEMKYLFVFTNILSLAGVPNIHLQRLI